ncbi:hypothetical protein [Pseudolactococcus laudensis]
MNDNYKFDDSFDELLKEKYVDAMSQIKAPNELVDKTKLAIRAELATETRSGFFDKRIKMKFFYGRLFLVALLILFIGSGFVYYHQRDQIHIMAVSQNQVSMNKSFGKFDTSHRNQKNKPIEVKEGDDSTIIPEFMAQVVPSKIKGQVIQLAQEGECYYAAFSRGKRYYFLTGKDVSKDAFINYLKNKLKNL